MGKRRILLRAIIWGTAAAAWVVAGVAAVVAGVLVVLTLARAEKADAGGPAEEFDTFIQLPVATAVQPLEIKDEYIMLLNVNKDGHVFLSDLDAIGEHKTLSNVQQVQRYMKRRADEDFRAAGGDRAKPPRSVVILRVDKEAPFVRAEGSDKPGVWDILKSCRAAGYDKVHVQVIRGETR
ncbi:MAG: biopolymer transporter ExbD [Gemmataceae bacterium]|nr:biopolymer transporter ExbD [Gemmataceae bacterium]